MFKQLHDLRKNSRGVAAVEAAIMLPLLFFMLLAMADVGRLVIYYLRFSQLAHEGVRLAAGTVSLEENTLQSTKFHNGENHLSAQSSGSNPRHEKVHRQVLVLVENQNIAQAFDEIEIESQFTTVPGPMADTIQFTVKGTFRNLFTGSFLGSFNRFVLPNLKISVSQRGPWLFQ